MERWSGWASNTIFQIDGSEESAAPFGPEDSFQLSWIYRPALSRLARARARALRRQTSLDLAMDVRSVLFAFRLICHF